MRSLLTAGLVALACLGCCAGAAQAAPSNMVALGTGANANTLYRFSGDSPGTTTAVPVTGLGVSNLVGIDYRPATLELIGLGVNGNVTTLFAIDPATGVATQVGLPATASSITGATAFGISFNPTVDRLRVVGNLASDGAGGNANNFRLNPNNGALAGLDADLDFSGLPGGLGNAPLTAIAYDRKVVGTTASTLYGIAAGGDRLVRLGGVDGSPPSPNLGILFNVGLLGIDATSNAGFDTDPASGEAYAALKVAGVTGLYRIDLATGAATAVGSVGDGTTDFGSLTIKPQFPTPSPPPPPTPPVEPKLEALSVKPKAFAVAGTPKAKATGSTVAAPRGTTVNYTVSAAATVSFSVERKTIGRKVGKACKRQTKGNRGNKRCPLWKPLKAGFAKTGAAGPNSFRFDGKLGGKALTLGAYRLLARLGGTTLTAGFRIVPAVPGPPPLR